MDKVRYLIGIVFCLLMMGVGTVKAEDINVSQQQENVDAKDIVFAIFRILTNGISLSGVIRIL